MAYIIAASVQLQDQAENVIKQLINAGFAPDKVTSFYVNPPGQHALYPIGGDRYKSPDEEGNEGTSTTLEAAAANVAEAVMGIMENKDSSVNNQTSQPAIKPDASESECGKTQSLRSAGMLVAVELADSTHQDKAVSVLVGLGANNIESAEGEIIDGEWHNFDPLIAPCYLKI